MQYSIQETTRLRNLLKDIGRSDVKTDFHSSNYEQKNEEKYNQREIIADFILSSFSDKEKIKLLSFPGVGWIFENMMLLRHPAMQIVGIEQSMTIFMKSAQNMVHGAIRGRGSKSVIHIGYQRHKVSEYGNGNYHYYRTPVDKSIYSLRSHRLLNMSFYDYVNAMTTDYGQSIEQVKKFHEKFMSRNAAWIDFTGPIQGKNLEAIKKIPLLMSNSDKKKPVAITFLNARDDNKGLESRIDRIRRAVPEYEIEDYWKYNGSGNSSMGTVIGYIV